MSTLIILVMVACLMCFAMGLMVPTMGLRLYRLRKSLVIWVEPNSRSVEFEYVNVSRGKVKKGEKDYLLEGPAKHSGKHGTWLIDPVSGWNWIAPPRAKTFDKELKLAILEPSNPQSYHKAMQRWRWSDVMRAGEDRTKSWVPIVVVGGVIVVAMLFAALAYIINHLPVPK